MFRIYISLLIAVFFQYQLIAQNSVEVKFIEEEAAHFNNRQDYLKHKTDYFTQFEYLDIPTDPNYFYKNKIDISAIDKYDRLGIDIIGLGKRYGKLRFSDYIVTSDAIVEGEVIKEEFFSDPKNYFHSKYTIKLTGESFRSNGASEFFVFSSYGPTGSSHQSFSHQLAPDKGEKAIFFLRRHRVSELKKAMTDHLLPSSVSTINVNQANDPYYLVYKLYKLDRKLYDQDNQLIGKSRKKLKDLRRAAHFVENHNFYNQSFSKK